MTRKLGAIFGAAFAVILLAFFVGVWRPTQAQLAKEQAALVAAHNSSLSVAAQHAAVIAQQKQLPVVEQRATELAAAAPADPAIADLIDDFNTVAAASGVTIVSETWSVPSSTAPGAPTAPGAALPGGLVAIPITIGVQGTQANLLVFVHNLSQSSRLVTVKQLSLQSPSTAPSAPVTTMVTATVYEDPTPLPSPPKGK